MQSVWVFEEQGMLQSHSLILGFSRWYLVLEELLIVALITSSEVRNKLCKHLGASVLIASFSLKKRGYPENSVFTPPNNYNAKLIGVPSSATPPLSFGDE